jgi:hypothetical protein
MERKLNTTAIYVLSVLSFLCCCFAGLGIVLALPAFLMANKKLSEVALHPQDYEANTMKAMKTAKTVALIALSINGAILLYSIYVIATSDWAIFTEKFKEAMDKAQEK